MTYALQGTTALTRFLLLSLSDMDGFGLGCVCVNPYFVASSLSRSLFSASCKTLNVGCKIFRFKQLVTDFLPSVHSDIVMKLILKCTTLDLKIVCVVECSSVKKNSLHKEY